MTTKPPAIESTRRPDDPAAEEVVLKDESDVIIDDLKRQLESLQQQLDRYKDTEREAPLAENVLDGEMTRHIASHLQIPAEELNTRLERLIEQVTDPDLKAELIHCRDTAFFLFDTFQRISEKHGELTASLADQPLELEIGELCARLDSALHDRSLQVRVSADSSMPNHFKLPQQSVITVLITLADLALEIFGRPGTARLRCPGGEALSAGGDGAMVLDLHCESPWGREGGDEAVSAAVIRSGVRSRAVVDLLYVEKIIEMRGGSLEFLKESGRIHGFSVSLPMTAVEQE